MISQVYLILTFLLNALLVPLMLTHPQQVQLMLARAQGCYHVWHTTSFAERSEALTRVAKVIETNQRDYATLMAQEMGKPLAEGLAELEKCASTARYFAEHAEGFLADQQ